MLAAETYYYFFYFFCFVFILDYKNALFASIKDDILTEADPIVLDDVRSDVRNTYDQVTSQFYALFPGLFWVRYQ